MPGILDALWQTWPGRAAQGILGGMMAPGDAYSGRLPMVDENGRTSMDAIGRAADLAGTVMSGTLAAAPARAAGEAVLGSGPIKAYHGSPHDFDRFDLSKIGTGEGAQAYGHGLYFADKEETARAYRDALKWKGSDWDNPQFVASFWRDHYKGDVGRAVEHLQGAVSHQSTPAARTAVEQAVTMLQEGIPLPGSKNPGRMYEVNIHADPNKLLDWDKPVSAPVRDILQAQAQRVLRDVDYGGARNEAKDAILALRGNNITGAGAYDRLGMMNANSNSAGIIQRNRMAATDALREAGIPGIKYLDQGSRGAGEGSRNYVMFDDKLIEILRKYGLAGLAPMAAAPYFMPQQPQAQ